MDRLNISTGRLCWAIDHKGPMNLNSKPHYVLCAVEVSYRLVNFSLAKTTSAQETADLLFKNIFCVYGSAVEIISDRSKSFVNELFQSLLKLGNAKVRVTSSYAPWSNFAEERAVRKLSSALKAVCYGRSPSEWALNLKYAQLMINSSTVSPYLSSPPFALLMGSENSFFHPLLVIKEDKIPFNQFWTERIKKMREINDVLIKKYDVYLSQKSNKRHTVETLGLKIGDSCWIRIFAFSSRLKYLKHLLPSWRMAKIEKIVGKTSLLLRDSETGKLISRHLQDVSPVKLCGNFQNLFTDSLTAQKNEIEEDFEGLKADQIPHLDGTAIDGALKTQNPDESEDLQAKWQGRLRRRKKDTDRD